MIAALLRCLGLLVLVGVQSALGSRLAILGVPPDLPLVAVMLVAFFVGSARGGVLGLCVGLLLDLLRGSRIGLFALAMGVAAWLCGEAAARVDPARASVRAVVAAGAAGVYGLVIVLGAMAFDRSGVHAAGALRHLVVAALYDGMLATLAYWPVADRARGGSRSVSRPMAAWGRPERWGR